jgi:hypothetical protein
MYLGIPLQPPHIETLELSHRDGQAMKASTRIDEILNMLMDEDQRRQYQRTDGNLTFILSFSHSPAQPPVESDSRRPSRITSAISTAPEGENCSSYTTAVMKQ